MRSLGCVLTGDSPEGVVEDHWSQKVTRLVLTRESGAMPRFGAGLVLGTGPRKDVGLYSTDPGRDRESRRAPSKGLDAESLQETRPKVSARATLRG